MIDSHKKLAEHIAGKRILHLNSLGKDSVASLEWLVNYAHPSHVVSVFFEFMAHHPDDERYFKYLQKRYPSVEFIKEPNANEISHIVAGRFQSPIEVMREFNHWEYIQFYMDKHAGDLKKQYNCDYISIGQSRYESVARASNFYKKGILIGDKIYPLGMMSKDDIINAIRASGLKLHPCYKVSPSTLDKPSYYRMRSTFITNPEYWERMVSFYPLLILDKYRYEVLFK